MYSTSKNGRCVVLPQTLCRVCWLFTPYPWIFDEAWDDCCPPAALLSRFGPCGLFLVPEVEILTERLPISDGRGDRRKFNMGPSRRPAKHVPEMEKTLGAVTNNFCILHNTVEHNCISSSSTLGLQLHVSALYVGHLQVVTWLSEQLYKMCGVFF